jgi:ketosteroid isomerase-like protein
VREFLDAFHRGDRPGILACLADDVEWILPGAFHLRGKQAFAKEIEQDIFVNGPAIAVTRVIEENDIVVAEGSVRSVREDCGTSNGVFCDVFVMQDARIRHLTSYLMELKE